MKITKLVSSSHRKISAYKLNNQQTIMSKLIFEFLFFTSHKKIIRIAMNKFYFRNNKRNKIK